MASYKNLPGVVVDLIDGNLPTPVVSLGQVTLILGTSGSGPSNKLFLVTDPSNIEIAYDKNGTLVRGMIEALEGGARTVALYRIGANPAVGTGIAHGNAAGTGFTITSADADDEAGTKLKLSYDSVKGYLYIYDVDTDTLVYSDDPEVAVNLNRAYVDGAASGSATDIGMRQDASLSVTAAQKTIVVTGDVTAYYKQGDFIDVTTSSTTNKINEGKYRIGSVVFSTNTTITFNAKVGDTSWTGWAISEASAITMRHQTPITLESLGQDKIDPESFAATISGTTVTVTASEAGTAVDESLWYFVSDTVSSETGFYYNPAAPTGSGPYTMSLATTTPNGSAVTFTSTAGTLYEAGTIATTTFTLREDITTSGSTNTKLFVGQRVYVHTDVISERGYYYIRTGITFGGGNTTFTVATAAGGSAVSFTSTKFVVYDLVAWDYVPGADGLSGGYRDLYEALAKAYRELETAAVDFIIPMGTYLDAPNVSDDALLSHTDDALLYLRTTEVSGELEFSWLDATELAALEISDPDTAAEYHEVNFAYQLSRYCYDLDRNEHSCLGFINTTPPVGYSKGQLSGWYGKSPTYDNLGNIIANGTGLLGNKHMVGSLTVAPGFYATSNNELDGVTEKDANNKSIDIGKYLSVCASPVLLRNGFNGGYIGGLAATYAGLVNSLPLSISPLNQILKASAQLPFALPKTVLDDMTGSRYVLLSFNSSNQTRVVDAPTAAMPASDYQRLSTMRIVADIVQRTREIGDPYLGKATNAGKRDILRSQIDRMLGQKAEAGLVGNDSYSTVKATRAQEVKGECYVDLLLTPSFEMRQLKVSVSLA